MARNTYGLDLGSYEIKVYDKSPDKGGQLQLSVLETVRRLLMVGA